MMTSFLLLNSLTTHLELAENEDPIDHLAGKGGGGAYRGTIVAHWYTLLIKFSYFCATN